MKLVLAQEREVSIATPLKKHVGKDHKIVRDMPPCSPAPLVAVAGGHGMTCLTPQVRALNKKLRHIEILMERQKEGETLNEEQQQKVDSLGEVMQQLEQFIGEQ